MNIKMRLMMDGYWWNTVTINGRMYALRRLGKSGECVVP